MNQESSKLGRGLSALLSGKTNNPQYDKKFKMINITSIQPNTNQPRKNFKENELKELAKSIKSKGMIQPILVREINDNNYLKSQIWVDFDCSGSV